MSKSVCVFVKSDCKLEQVVSLVENVIGHKLDFSTTDFGPLFSKDAMGLEFSIYTDDMDDKDGIKFSDYSTIVDFSIRSGFDNELRFELCRVLALRTAHVIQAATEVKCLVVEDDEKILST